MMLATEQDALVIESYSDISPTEKIGDVKNKLLGNAYQSMKETLQLVDEGTLEKRLAYFKRRRLFICMVLGPPISSLKI